MNAAHRSVIRATADGPVFAGQGSIDYACAHCGRLLVERAWPDRFFDLSIECPACKKTSDFPNLTHPIDATLSVVWYPEGVYPISKTIQLRDIIVNLGIGYYAAPGTVAPRR